VPWAALPTISYVGGEFEQLFAATFSSVTALKEGEERDATVSALVRVCSRARRGSAPRPAKRTEYSRCGGQSACRSRRARTCDTHRSYSTRPEQAWLDRRPVPATGGAKRVDIF
jgi:hypothetical protein